MTTCSVCDSEDWIRADPGQDGDASSLNPDQRQAVLLFPSDAPAIPTVAWCIACDPLIVRLT